MDRRRQPRRVLIFGILAVCVAAPARLPSAEVAGLELSVIRRAGRIPVTWQAREPIP